MERIVVLDLESIRCNGNELATWKFYEGALLKCWSVSLSIELPLCYLSERKDVSP